MINFKLCLVVLVLLTSTQYTQSNTHPLHKEIMEFISTQPTKTQFKLWHYAFNKEYDINSELGLSKYKTFKDNIKYIKEENAKNAGYTLGLGPFTDLSFEEFEKTHLNFAGKNTPEYSITAEDAKNRRNLGWFDDMVDMEEGNPSTNTVAGDDLTENLRDVSKDWTSTWDRVKNQGNCGSCWAFSVIGNVEAHARINGHPEFNFSEQQMIDCDPVSMGCKGGFTHNSYLYIKNNGLMSESSYPYEEKEGTCRFDKTKVAYKGNFRYCSNTLFLCYKEKIMKMLETGPYSAPLLANKSTQHYSQGDIAPEECLTVNHAVVVVHVNHKKGIIKFRNSWGPEWGENGYGKLKIANHNGLEGCGLLAWAHQPIFPKK
jgi:C1A family cysteine protease